ncbi:MAG: hypothetical protein ACOYXA_07410 [Bacteroidota bacterium]
MEALPWFERNLRFGYKSVDLAWFDAEHDDHHLVKINLLIAKLRTR